MQSVFNGGTDTIGFYLDYPNRSFGIGDTLSTFNGNYVKVNDTSEIVQIKGDVNIELDTILLYFPNTAIQDNTSRSYTGRNIIVQVGSNTYYLPLYS